MGAGRSRGSSRDRHESLQPSGLASDDELLPVLSVIVALPVAVALLPPSDVVALPDLCGMVKLNGLGRK